MHVANVSKFSSILQKNLPDFEKEINLKIKKEKEKKNINNKVLAFKN